MRSSRAVLLLLPILFFTTTKRVTAQDAQSRLWDAAMAGDTAAIRKAVSDGAKVDLLDTRQSPNGRYALNWAAWFNKPDAVKVLLELKAPLEAENITGFTALTHAAENGSLDAAKVLLAAGADPDHATKNGFTPVVVATGRGHDELAKLLQSAPRKKK